MSSGVQKLFYESERKTKLGVIVKTCFYLSKIKT
jgi:hypothetical protein